MRKKEILLITALVLFGFLYQFFESGEIIFLKGCDGDPKKIIDKNHPNYFTDNMLFNTDIRSLKIFNPAGDISIELSPDEKIIVEVTSVIYHRDKSEIDKIKNEYSIKKFEESGKGTINVVNTNGVFPYSRARINFKIKIPREIKLDIFNRFGNVSIDGAGKNIIVDEKFGDLQIENVDSEIKVRSSYGNIYLNNIRDNIDLNAKFAKTEIEGSASIDCRISYSTLSISEILQSKKVDINGVHTKIILSGINSQQIKIKNSHQLIRADNISAESLSITSRHCRIITDKINVNEIIIKNSHNRTRLENISGKNISVLIKHGDLFISPYKNIENINILNSYSDIKLKLPPGLDPGFNLTTKYGKIINNTKFDFNTIRENYKLTLTRTGETSQIVINTSYGKIFLENEKE